MLGGFGMFAVALLIAGTLSASALAGSNTVTSDDILDGQVYTTDIRDSNITSADVKNDGLTGDDINEGTLDVPGFKIPKDSGTLTMDFSSLDTHECRGAFMGNRTIGEVMLLSAPKLDGRLQARIQVQGLEPYIYVCNFTAGAIDPAQADFSWVTFDVP